MRVQEKKRQRMYDLLNAETETKISFPLWPPSSPDLNPAEFHYMEHFRKQLPIAILVRLIQLLQKKGIKCLKNLF